MNAYPLRQCLASLALLSLPFSPILAQSDDFNDGNDTGWTRYNPLASFGAGGTYAISSGAYRVQAPPSPNPELLGPSRIGSLFPAASFTRSRTEADIFGWEPTLTQSLGLFARAGDLGLGTTTGYTYNYNVLSGFHQINLVLNEAPSRVVNESAYALDPAHRYRMVFTALDNRFLGQLYSATNNQVPIHSLYGTDDTLATGRSGIFAFAINVTHGVDARFDNFSVAVPSAPVRATFLDSAPAAGEIPTAPVVSVVIRLVSLETAIDPGSLRLTLDGVVVPFESTEFESVQTLVHTPAAPLSPGSPHQAAVRFKDEQGEQTFAWSFGTPTTARPKLLAATTLSGPFTEAVGTTLDEANRRFTLPTSGNERFFRIQDTAARTLRSIRILAEQVQIDFD